MTWLTVLTALKRIPVLAWLIIGIAIALVIGAIAIEHHGEKKGEKAAKRAPLEKALQMGAVRITADSSTSIATKKRADSAHARSVPRAEAYILTRAKVRELPDSVMNGVPKIVITAMERGDSAVMSLLSETATLRTVVAADSTEKVGLRLQLARTDSLTAIIADESGSRCGFKCGVAIGVVVVGGLIALLSR